MAEKYIRKGIKPDYAETLYSLERRAKAYIAKYKEDVEDQLQCQISRDPNFFWNGINPLADKSPEFIDEVRRDMREKWVREIFFEFNHCQKIVIMVPYF